jgi:hypothetical protein
LFLNTEAENNRKGQEVDFILVPDTLAASETCHALAQRNTMGAKVGSFSVLLETLAELWLIEPSDLDWGASIVHKVAEP